MPDKIRRIVYAKFSDLLFFVDNQEESLARKKIYLFQS